MNKFLKKTIWISLICFNFFQIELVRAIVPYYYFPTKKNLQNQMANRVNWTQSIKKLEEIGEKKIIEIGPNKILSGLIKRISNNFDIEDLFINEPPIDEVIGKVLIKKDYDI